MPFDRYENEIYAVLSSIRKESISIPYCKHIDQNSEKWILQPHSHPCMEMIFFLNGDAHIDVEGDEFNATIYDVVVYMPHAVHHEDVDLIKSQEIICIWLGIDFDSSAHVKSFKVCDLGGELRWLFEQIHKEYRINSPVSREIAKAYAQAVIGHYMRHFSYMHVKEINSAEMFDGLKSYIHQNLSSEITPAHLSKMCNISISYLFRLFKQHMGTTPSNYVNKLRIETAQKMLETTQFTISEISKSLGFMDASYFSRVFRANTGVTPNAYRALQNKTEAP